MQTPHMNPPTLDLRKLNTLTKYPSILTYHSFGEKGRLVDELTEPEARDQPLYVYEKVDGENARIILLRNEEGEIDYFIGSREELLYAKGDRLAIPNGNIAELLKPLAARMAEQFASDKYEHLSAMVLFMESYGGKTPAAKQYTTQRDQQYRFFDVFTLSTDAFQESMATSVEQIAAWRERGSQPYYKEAEKAEFAAEHQLAAAPLLGKVDEMPLTITGTLDFLMGYATTQVAMDGAAGKSEGVIIRNANRSVIKKIRFEDYERTLRVK